MPLLKPLAPAHSANDTNPSFEPLFDSDAAATLLKVHPKTLQRMARRGEIPAIQIGKLWRFRASELNAWLNAQHRASCQGTSSAFQNSLAPVHPHDRMQAAVSRA